MAELNTVARPYTKAAFEHAVAKGSLDQWSEMLATATAVAKHETMKLVLDNPSFTREQKAEAMISVCEEQMDQSTKNFIHLLAENQRLALLPEISEQFEQLKANQQHSVEVNLTTAFDLGEQQQQKLTQALSSKLGREVSLTTEVDKSIIGGVIVRTDDMVIDGSIRARLAKLAEAMNS
ncbi:F0F1 ATP synthase subunit delta [Amphritea sp. 2_MG-2023]|uniref:F0F1 ATP synthase subunit delta n=1 Tax=Amphritea TaxID=515417 RepID=UPI001C068CED|nr:MULTISPECIES: F0F1 ATP synthase subunit delta [Amphritea]MBU2967684.1 F0F1 ATP synthase subunit delta [Amphritea atlantica]MDO6416999.1 F0F1 ATP synthase subunit delta [Amphritea sp. 2_MG-2023]